MPPRLGRCFLSRCEIFRRCPCLLLPLLPASLTELQCAVVDACPLSDTESAMLSASSRAACARLPHVHHVLLCHWLLCSVLCVGVLGGGQSYSLSSPVPILVNTVGPFHNPAESYKYYSLPYCEPSDSTPAPPQTSPVLLDENLGEVLAGDRRRGSLYDIKFNVAEDGKVLCERKLSVEDVAEFVHAIRAHYVFEMFVDELAVKGFIGEMEEDGVKGGRHRHNQEDNDNTQVFLFTHLDFAIAHNDGRVSHTAHNTHSATPFCDHSWLGDPDWSSARLVCTLCTGDSCQPDHGSSEAR